MRDIIKDAYLILVTTPSQYHTVVATDMAPYLQDGQIVVLNPGRTFGTYVFDKTLREKGCTADVVLGETDTFIFTCRCNEIAKPIIYEIKKGMKVAAHRKEDTPLLMSALSAIFPNLEAAESVLETGLSNIGMIFHPLPILMNITRIDAKEKFLFYHEGITPLVSQVLEQLDSERVSIAKGLGVEVPAAYDWLNQKYGSQGSNLYERIQDTQAYRDVLAPTDIDTRYIFEDIQTGCVPISCLGREMDIKTDTADAAIKWASAVYRKDFYATGRNSDAVNFQELLADA